MFNGIDFTRYRKSSSKPALVPWATGTDDQIVAMVNGYYDGALTIDEIKSVWSIGDCRSVDLAAMEAIYVGESHRAQTVEMMIIDFEHDDLTTPINDKQKALVSINQKNVLSSGDVYEINDQQNTEKGYLEDAESFVWDSSSRRKWCNEVYYQSIPAKIREIIKECGKETNYSIVDDLIFLLSITETGATSRPSDGYKYSLFDIAENRAKKPPYPGYISCSYWTRTASGNTAYRVTSATTAASNPTSTLYGIAPAFCL